MENNHRAVLKKLKWNKKTKMEEISHFQTSKNLLNRRTESSQWKKSLLATTSAFPSLKQRLKKVSKKEEKLEQEEEIKKKTWFLMTHQEKRTMCTIKNRFEKHYIKAYSYEQLVNGFQKGQFKKIVVVTGAGISVSAGIPDFRSPKTGLYDNLKQYNLPTPESIFRLTYFKKYPEPFYHMARDFLDLNKF